MEKKNISIVTFYSSVSNQLFWAVISLKFPQWDLVFYDVSALNYCADSVIADNRGQGSVVLLLIVIASVQTVFF